MRHTSIVLDEIRERVSSATDYVEAKRLLHEISLTYFVAQPFVEAHDAHRQDATFLILLINDLLDELFLQSLHNPIKRPCNN